MLNQFASDNSGIPALDMTPLEAQRAIVRAIEDDCRRERGLRDHWAYNYPLHMQLCSKLTSARAALALMERGIPTAIVRPEPDRPFLEGGHPDCKARREHGTHWGKP